MIDLSIIIVNYNLSREILKCLQSISFHVRDMKYECIIVDNASTMEEKSVLSQFVEHHVEIPVKLLYLDYNGGFSTACNYGARKSYGEYLCFLNPDTLLEDNIFPRLLEVASTYRNCGVIGVRQKLNSTKWDYSYSYFPNIIVELLDILFVGRLISMCFKFLRPDVNVHEVDWVSGAFMFLRRSIFESAGGFDQDYFMYSEDMDLCWRLGQKGLRVLYLPRESIVHMLSTGSKKDYYFFTKNAYRSKLLFIRKRYVGVLKAILLLITYIQLAVLFVTWIMLYPLFPQKANGKLSGIISVFRSAG